MVGKSEGELYSGEAVEVENEDGEETRNPRPVARPVGPTRAQIEERYPLHLNYRSCPTAFGAKRILNTM